VPTGEPVVVWPLSTSAAATVRLAARPGRQRHAHRAARNTWHVRDCADRITVLADQGIAEPGSHDALIAAGGAYAGLYRRQASL